MAEKGKKFVDNVKFTIENLREELEKLIQIKGIGHVEVLKLSQRLDKCIVMHYLKK